MFRSVGLVLFGAVFFFQNIKAAKILVVVPTPAISHHVELRPLTKELASRGHEVVVVTTDPEYQKGQTPKNLTEIDIHDVTYEMWQNQIILENYGDRRRVRRQIMRFSQILSSIFEEQNKAPGVQELLLKDSTSFDLIIVEAWTRYALGFSHAFKAPVIAISSFGAYYDNYHVIGAPTHALQYPAAMNTRLYNLSLWEKIEEFCDLFTMIHEYRNVCEELENSIIRRSFGITSPTLSELQNDIHMMFLSIHPIWEGIRPDPPGVVYIGGVRQVVQKDIPEDLKEYLDSSTNGVIYVSFGTNVNTSVLPVEKIQFMVKAFSELPYDFIWKLNQEQLPGKAKNIKISRWFPQSDLLWHPKIKLFITQGGLQSTNEAIAAGVPLIGVPMLGDQWFNTEKYEYFKIGMQLQFHDLNKESLTEAIETIIGDKSYRDNIVRLRTLMQDQPMSSLDRAIWWMEYVLRHKGTPYLRAPAANMPWTQYYELELLLAVICVTLTLIIFSLIVIRKIVIVIYCNIPRRICIKS